MDSLTSSQANQPYSPLNRVNLDMNFEQLLNTQDYYQSQDYSMGHGSVHGSAPVDDDSPVEEMSPVKKPSKRASRAKKNDAKDKGPAKDWTKAEEIALCRTWCDVSKNSEKGNSMKVKGFWEAVINYFKKETGSTRGHDFTLGHCYNILKDHQGWLEIEMPAFYKNTKGRKKSKTSKITSGSASGGFNLNDEADEYEKEAREHRPLGRGASKAKKKSSASSRERSSSFVDLAAHKEATDLKREKLEIQLRKLQLAGKKKRDKDILFYNSEINPSLPAIQQKLQEMENEIKEYYNLYY
ncbi:ABC transporter G family member 7 isoform X2 [Tanacetum coccineum]|uniref:ABC transporter G family member 7 isoform X2 n=1 Tax=Tanacetum coccineum TaxID=301880 RepID=A0ABQ5H7F1_9ASTR